MSFIIDSLSCLVNGLSEVIRTLKTISSAALAVNHDVMSTLIQFTVNFFSTLWAALNFVFVVIQTLVVCVIDFLTELFNFAAAFLYFLWKLIILLYSFLDLIFHSVECVVYFLWTGGKWTAETLKASGNNFSENGLSTWKYFVLSLKDFTNSVIGGFSTIGYCAKSVGITVLDGICLSYSYLSELIYKADCLVRDVCNYFTDLISYFFTDFLMTISQEAYFGVLISVVICLICVNVIRIMNTEGFTFPVWYRSTSSYDDESDAEIYDQRGRGEFSDDEDIIDLTVTEYDDYEDEFSVNSDVSDSSTSASFDDDVELEVDSDSDNESNAASENEMSEINIQLPDIDAAHHQRRSTTPSRFTKHMSSDDLQKVIEAEKERRTCVVCQDRNKSVLILPCRHMCLCVECGNHIARSRTREGPKCPLCRTRINTIMNVYI